LFAPPRATLFPYTTLFRSDDTPKVAAHYAAADPRVRTIRNRENIGVIANYNLAMELARGEFICCMGDDDAVLLENFERKIALLEDRKSTRLNSSHSQISYA